MALRVIWTLAAWNDLETIIDYIAKDSRFYAVAFVQESIQASRSLVYLPARGRRKAGQSKTAGAEAPV